MRWATALALQSSDFFTISLTHLFHGREPLHKWRRACNTGADGRRCRLHTRHRNPKKPSVCKKTTFRNYDAYTHDARNTRRTTHALHSPARLGANLSQKSHGCIGGRPPQRPRREGEHRAKLLRAHQTPSPWHSPGRPKPKPLAIRRRRCLAAWRLSANNGVTPKVPSSAPSRRVRDPAGRRDRALGSAARCVAGTRLSRQRGAPRRVGALEGE